MGSFALLASPFLGPEVWSPVAEELRARGHRSTIVAGRGSTPAEVTLDLLAGLPATEEVVLVPHSNVGLYVPALVAARPVGGAVFVDAVFPGPGRTTPVAAAELAERVLRQVDEEGRIPPWTRWWPERELADLFPDEETRRVVEAGQPRVAAWYLRGRVATPPGWETGLPAAYLAFGDTYDLETALAREWGWPVTVLAGRHLHQLVDPPGVVDALLALSAGLERRRAGRGSRD